MNITTPEGEFYDVSVCFTVMTGNLISLKDSALVLTVVRYIMSLNISLPVR